MALSNAASAAFLRASRSVSFLDERLGTAAKANHKPIVESLAAFAFAAR
jgi:hypothetical protein